MQDLAREVRLPVSFNLNRMDRSKDAWRRVLASLDREPGLPLYAQVAGRAIGLIMALDGTAHPFAAHRAFRELGSLPAADLRAQLRSPSVRARILAETPPSLGPFGDFITRSFHRMFAVSGAVDYEPAPDASIAALAGREGRAPLEVAYDHMAAGGFLYFPLFNYADGSLEPTLALHRHPRTRMGLGDAGPTAGRSATGACRPSCSRTGRATGPGARGSRSSTSCGARPARRPSSSASSTAVSSRRDTRPTST